MGWLQYAGAFGCAVAVFLGASMAAATISLSGPIWSMAQLLSFIYILPAVAGICVFGLTYPAFTGHAFDRADWLTMCAVVAVMLVLFLGIIVLRVTEAIVGAVFCCALLFAVGAAMHARKSNA